MRMPVLFVGHGSPMNAIEVNDFTYKWEKLGKEIEERFGVPKAILCISAHWESTHVLAHASENPKQIYDMYGFPSELYEKKYPVKGDPALAEKVAHLTHGSLDEDWGIDHGTWSVLCHMFPKADIPTLQLSIPHHTSFDGLHRIGHRLTPLRYENVLIIGSGNVVHNLRTVNWKMRNGYPHCEQFDRAVQDAVLAKDVYTVCNPPLEESPLERSFVSHEHYAPLPFVMGAVEPVDECEVFNDRCMMGSLSMTGYFFS